MWHTGEMKYWHLIQWCRTVLVALMTRCGCMDTESDRWLKTSMETCLDFNLLSRCLSICVCEGVRQCVSIVPGDTLQHYTSYDIFQLISHSQMGMIILEFSQKYYKHVSVDYLWGRLHLHSTIERLLCSCGTSMDHSQLLCSDTFCCNKLQLQQCERSTRLYSRAPCTSALVMVMSGQYFALFPCEFCFIVKGTPFHSN